REAAASGDVAWVRNTFRRVLRWSLALSACIAVLMAVVGQNLIGALARSRVPASEALILAYCGVYLFSAFQTPLAFLFNGLGKIRFQLFLAVPVVASSVLLKLMLVRRWGLPVIPCVTIGVGLVLMVPAQLLYLRHLGRQLRAITGRPLS